MTSSMIDLHIDCILQQRLFGYDIRKAHNALLPGQPLFWHADLPRLKEARYKGVCFGIHYWPWQSEKGWAEINQQINYLDQTVGQDPECIRVQSHNDWIKAVTHNKLAIAPGVEGAHTINGKLSRIEHLAKRHIAYMTLCHFSKNDAVTPSLGRGANEEEGLTDFGRDLVVELERHDILIDVAHVNMPGVLEVCAMATKPLLCTHTGVKGCHNTARNISDEAIDAIAQTGGVIGIMFGPMHLSKNLLADSSCILDHIDYVVDRVGIDHVALGSDYDGWMFTIARDMRDCRDIHRIPVGLEARGYSAEEISKITHGNALRILSRSTQ